MLDQDENFYLISLSILTSCLLDNVRILWGKLHVNHFWGLKGQNESFLSVEFIVVLLMAQ